MAKLFLVFGTPGAGKTTTLEGIKTAKLVTLGSEMQRGYSSRFGIKDRDMIRKKSLTVYNEMVIIRNAILRRLAGSPGTLLIDTHASVKSGDGYIAGLSMHDFEELKGKVMAIIYIDADTNEILKRRREDKSRKRENESAEELDRHRGINMIYTVLYSLYLQAPIYTVQNHDGAKSIAASRKRISEIIKSLK